jgi:DNA repair protein RadC
MIRNEELTPITYPFPTDEITRSLLLNEILPSGVLLHNRPSDDPSPSQADIQMTRAMVDIATPNADGSA